jgi:hypothetical protein
MENGRKLDVLSRVVSSDGSARYGNVTSIG